jgi:hypothetical protein
MVDELVASGLLIHHDNGNGKLLCNITALLTDQNILHLIAVKTQL